MKLSVFHSHTIHTCLLLVFSLTCIIFLAFPSITVCQDPKTRLFEEAEKAMAQAKTSQAEIFSPTQFENAMNYYNQADQDYKENKNIEDIQKKLKMSTVYFLKSVETTKLAHTNLKDCIGARMDALAAEAPQFRKEQWKEAEEEFKQSLKTLEEGNLNGAVSKSRKAEKYYRTVELESIKANYLDQTRSLLDEAKKKDVKKRSPVTLAISKELIQKAELLLSKNRYDTDESRQIAQEARYEAQHANYLNDLIKTMEDNKESIETVILNAEKPIQKIGDEFDLNVKFHHGMDQPVQNIILEIQKLKKQNASLKQDLRDRSEHIAALSARASEMESQLGDLKYKEATLTSLMEKQKQSREKFKRIEDTFTPDEAQILRYGDQVIIRLYGLTFSVGKSTIEPQYFGLLSKVIKAMNEYTQGHVTVEGHTDSRGSDATNQKLSTLRAKAVQEYFMATSGVDSTRVKAMGYGEAKPVASNETREGRRKNRRIDIVIRPGK